MLNAYIVTGTLINGQNVALDEWLPLSMTKVRLVVEPLSPPTRRPLHVVLAEIRRRQANRGQQPVLREEIDRYLAEERNSWGE